MSVEMKLGWWEDRTGLQWEVIHGGYGRLWRAYDSERTWFSDGSYWGDGSESPFDLIRYLGPLELSPTTACADQAGTPVVSTVSTETAGEQLQRMRERYNAMDREASIYSSLLAALDQAKSDLGECIRAMEKEHDL